MGSDGNPVVTVVIPTHRRTPVGLLGFRQQDIATTVMVLANGEATGVEGDAILQVDWLGHGATRMAAIEHITTEYTLFSVDDATPVGEGAVRALVEALTEGNYDAVFGRQIPQDDADVITVERLAEWTPEGASHYETDRHDHVFALYKTSTLREFPLPNVAIAEDLHWSIGRRIGYVPNAAVIHSHKRHPLELYRRTKAIHSELKSIGREPQVPSFMSLLGALPGVVKPTLKGGISELPNQIAELLGQWRGGR
jgi:hypothetical protein